VNGASHVFEFKSHFKHEVDEQAEQEDPLNRKPEKLGQDEH
jgi:hypothetical protein